MAHVIGLGFANPNHGDLGFAGRTQMNRDQFHGVMVHAFGRLVCDTNIPVRATRAGHTCGLRESGVLWRAIDFCGGEHELRSAFAFGQSKPRSSQTNRTDSHATKQNKMTGIVKNVHGSFFHLCFLFNRHS
jgi:hypothetical protein